MEIKVVIDDEQMEQIANLIAAKVTTSIEIPDPDFSDTELKETIKRIMKLIGDVVA